jgi:hypothetical protein
MKDKITFIAALNNATAIKIDGEGECKVTFEVPASELANVIKLVLKVGQTFRVVIEDE